MGGSVGKSQEEPIRVDMDQDRPYSCLLCHSGFKFKWHLVAHNKVCATKRPSTFVCETCRKKFTNNKSRKHHQKSCIGRKRYKCAECEQVFGTLQQRIRHKRIHHTAEECEFCGMRIKQGQNMKRHIKLSHSKLTPSSAKKLELIKRKKEEETNIGTIEGVLGDEELQNGREGLLPSETNITVEEYSIEDQILPQDSNKANDDAVSKPRAGSSKKKVSWKENLTATEEIERKIKITQQEEQEILAMIAELKKFLPILVNRKSDVELNTIKENYERISKKQFSETTFQIIVSLQTSNFQPFTVGNKTYVDVSDINILEEKVKAELERMIEEEVPYIYLQPMKERKKYDSAKEVLEKNIYEFSDVDSPDSDESDCNNNLTIMERIMKKHDKRNDKARKRGIKFQAKLPEWQKQRLPKLARIVDKIFIGKERNVMKAEELLQSVSNSDYTSMNIEEDFKKLVSITDGWLTSVDGGFVKRKPENLETINDLIIKEN